MDTYGYRALFDSAGRAAKGGQKGINGWSYKGGQFLPSTMAEPGKWKLGKKWVTTGREQVAPGKYEVQPTPLSRSIYTLIGPGYFTVFQGEKAAINPKALSGELFDPSGGLVTPDMQIKPGVKGILGKRSFSLQDLVDQYNKGARWIEIEPPEGITVVKG